MINEAIFALYEGVATAEAIDGVIKLGMNHPMGPLRSRFIGLDVCLAILRVLQDGFGDPKYRPAAAGEDVDAGGSAGRAAGDFMSTARVCAAGGPRCRWMNFGSHRVLIDESHALPDCSASNTTTRVLLPAVRTSCSSSLVSPPSRTRRSEDYEEEEDLSLDEHLLERVSGLEEIVKRSRKRPFESRRRCRNTSAAIFVNQPGLLSAKELLEKEERHHPAESWWSCGNRRWASRSSARKLSRSELNASCR